MRAPSSILPWIFLVSWSLYAASASAQVWNIARTPGESDTAVAGAYTDVFLIKADPGDRLRLNFRADSVHPLVSLISPQYRSVWRGRLASDSLRLDGRLVEPGLWHIVVRQPVDDGLPSYNILLQLTGSDPDTLQYAPNDADIVQLFADLPARDSGQSAAWLIAPTAPDTVSVNEPLTEPENWIRVAFGGLSLLLVVLITITKEIEGMPVQNGFFFRPLATASIYNDVSFEGFNRWAIGGAIAAGITAFIWAAQMVGGHPVAIFAIVLAAFNIELMSMRPLKVHLHLLPLLIVGAFYFHNLYQPFEPESPFVAFRIAEWLLLLPLLLILVAMADAAWQGIPGFVEKGAVFNVEEGRREEWQMIGQMPRFEWATSVMLVVALTLGLAHTVTARLIEHRVQFGSRPFNSVLVSLSWSGTAGALTAVVFLTAIAVMIYTTVLAFRNARFPLFPGRILPIAHHSRPSGVLAGVYIAVDAFWSIVAVCADITLRTFFLVVASIRAIGSAASKVIVLYLIRTIAGLLGALRVGTISMLLLMTGICLGILGEQVSDVIILNRGRVSVLVAVLLIVALLSLSIGAWTVSVSAMTHFALGAIAVATCGFITSAVMVALAALLGLGSVHVGLLTYGCGALLILSFLYRPQDAIPHQDINRSRGTVGLVLSITYIVWAVLS